MTSNENYSITSPVGRTFIVSSLFTILIYAIMALIALNNKDTIERSNWPSFLGILYTDKLVKDMNIGLVVFAVIMFTLSFFFLLVAWGSFQEMRMYLPSWGSVFGSYVVNFLVAWLLVSLTVGEGAIVGSAGSSEVTNYTFRMRWVILLAVAIFQALVIVYVYFTGEQE